MEFEEFAEQFRRRIAQRRAEFEREVRRLEPQPNPTPARPRRLNAGPVRSVLRQG